MTLVLRVKMLLPFFSVVLQFSFWCICCLSCFFTLALLLLLLLLQISLRCDLRSHSRSVPLCTARPEMDPVVRLALIIPMACPALKPLVLLRVLLISDAESGRLPGRTAAGGVKIVIDFLLAFSAAVSPPGFAYNDPRLRCFCHRRCFSFVHRGNMGFDRSFRLLPCGLAARGIVEIT